MGEGPAEQPIFSSNTQNLQEEETQQQETTATTTGKFYMSLELGLESRSKAPNQGSID